MSSETWDEHWMEHVAFKANSKSKDKSRKIGAVVVTYENDEVCSGWNGFPRGFNDDVPERHLRPQKYKYTVHAEKNAFGNAARLGRATKGCKIYQNLFPCSGCAGMIIQCGICEVITIEPDFTDPTYGEDWAYAKEMLEECGVKIRYVQGELPVRKEIIPDENRS